MTKKQISLLVIAVFLLSSASVWAQMRGRGQGMGMAMSDWYNPLNLTPEQMAKVRNMRMEHHKELIDIHMDMQKKRLELMSLISENADQKAIDAKIEEISPFMEKMMKKTVDHWKNVRGILNEEQKAVFDMMHQSGMGMGFGMMGMGRGMMGMGPDMMGRGMGMMNRMGGNWWRNRRPWWW